MKLLPALILSSAIAAGGYYSFQKGSAKPVDPSTPHSIQPTSVNPAEAGNEVGLADTSRVPAFAAAKISVSAEDGATSPDTEADKEIVFEESELITAVEQGLIQATIRGNGRESVVAQLRNNSPTPLRLTVPAGQVFESGRNAVVSLRTAKAEVMPAQSVEITLTTAALLSSNKLGDGAYKLSYQYVSRVIPFLNWLGEHPEVPVPAAQTAVLALMENLPANALAKFAPSNGIPSKLETDAFRVESSELIAALTALRGCGARMESLALANDSQVKLELMIEPLTRESAKRFYGITEEGEWDFWKHELLQGDPSTRHYALFGIARFYPEIALEMLPKWVREPKTHPVYRMSAIQAIADTQKPEALSILHQLSQELGADTELGKAASQAASFLDQRLSQRVDVPVVAFRGKPTDPAVTNGL